MILNINVWQPEEKRKKAVRKTVLINDLWFFMNFCTNYEWENENFVQNSSIFHFILVLSRQKFARHLVW